MKSAVDWQSVLFVPFNTSARALVRSGANFPPSTWYEYASNYNVTLTAVANDLVQTYSAINTIYLAKVTSRASTEIIDAAIALVEIF